MAFRRLIISVTVVLSQTLVSTSCLGFLSQIPASDSCRRFIYQNSSLTCLLPCIVSRLRFLSQILVRDSCLSLLLCLPDPVSDSFLRISVSISYFCLRFLSQFLDTYKNYRPDIWYYNGGEKPVREVGAPIYRERPSSFKNLFAFFMRFLRFLPSLCCEDM
jgi:hypothetical protein